MVPERNKRMAERNLDFDKVIKRQGTGCLKYDFAKQWGMPEDILPLWVADMDFETSSYVVDALAQRLQHGVFGYTESGDSYFEAVSGWMRMARQGDYRGLMIDTAEKSYSEKYLKKYRHFYPFLGLFGKPNDFGRFLIQAGSCLHHDTSAELETIGCPTLVIGGGQDQIVGPKASMELADRIPNSELFLYQDLGHALYEEAKDFPERVLRFLEAPVSKSVL